LKSFQLSPAIIITVIIIIIIIIIIINDDDDNDNNKIGGSPELEDKTGANGNAWAHKAILAKVEMLARCSSYMYDC